MRPPALSERRDVSAVQKMHSENPSQEMIGTTATNRDAAQSSTRSNAKRGARLVGRILFCWSWFVAGFLVLVLSPPALLIGSLLRRQDWIYWFAEFGARNWLRLTGVKVRVTGKELLESNQPYVFVANHYSYLDASPLFAYTGRRMGMIAKKELLKAPILGFGMGFVNVISIDR